MKIKIKKLDPDVKIPSYAHPGDAGMDMYAGETVTVLPGEVGKIKSGLSIEVPEGYVGLLWDKSGLSINHGIKTLSGVLDSGYRGEVVYGVINLGKESYTFEKGSKVTQMLIQPVERAEIEEVDKLSESSRGSGGFGSTGK